MSAAAQPGGSAVDLALVGEACEPPAWPFGATVAAHGDVAATARALRCHVQTTAADAVLLWDVGLGAPDPDRVLAALRRPGDLWHAGLCLGMAGLPGLIDMVTPTWMLNADPPADIEATSWRMSLRCCVVRTDVLRRMGGPNPAFASLEAASLEMGHRCIQRGVLMRHLPCLVPPDAAARAPCYGPPSFEDELRFIHYRHGATWARWAVLRALLTRYAPVATVVRAWRRVLRETRPAEPAPFHQGDERPTADARPGGARVTVLIPTVDREPYLRTLLGQMRGQTVPPHEMIVVDQTSAPPVDWAAEFPEMPIRVLYLGRSGQCSARNAGLQEATGDHILFVDDDDEVPPTLIERHLQRLLVSGADASCGVADEVGAGVLPEAFALQRASDVFPTNNTLVRRDALVRAGLFDLAYDRGQRADGDLGTRVYLTGSLMVLDPTIRVLHHHAPSGGLRKHGARVVTYAASRRSLWQRHLPTEWDLYRALRYHTDRQVRESVWLGLLGTFSVRGRRARRLARAVIASALLAHSVWQTRRRLRRARSRLAAGPAIASLGHTPDGEGPP